MQIALFDFDGTISDRDSFADFIFFAHGVPKTFLGVLLNSPVLLGYVLKIVPNWQAKEQVFSYFFKGWHTDQFDAMAKRHASERLPKLLRPAALKKIAWHKEQGHKIVVVSASFENYLGIWCKSLGLDLLGTQVEIKNDQLTGKFASKNCFGEEKIIRIKQAYNLADFDYVYAYGDSRGDLPLKTIADEFHYKPFR